jgi:hypothetical protein
MDKHNMDENNFTLSHLVLINKPERITCWWLGKIHMWRQKLPSGFIPLLFDPKGLKKPKIEKDAEDMEMDLSPRKKAIFGRGK